MLAPKRPFHDNTVTRNAVTKFPDWMKITKSESVGSRFYNALIGTELDLFKRTANEYATYTNVVDAPIDSPFQLWHVDLEYPFISGVIKSVDDNGNHHGFNIYAVEDKLSFFTNPATRIELVETPFGPTGVANIRGLEWISSDPTGQLVIQQNTSAITASSTLYYNSLYLDNTVSVLPFSGDALGLDYIGLGVNSRFNTLNPEKEQSLRTKYEMFVWTTPTGDISTIPSGVPSTYSNYIDVDTGLKTYFYKGFNNPYGSGVFNQADVTLDYMPDPTGSLLVYDILNLTTSGTPYNIPASGRNVFIFQSGNWAYEGYDNPIPWSITPADIQADIVYKNDTEIEIVPTLSYQVSWRLMHSGGYIDDEIFPNTRTFDWIDGTGGYNQDIRFTNATSRYQAEYTYAKYNSIGQLSADPKSQQLPASELDNSTLYFTNNRSYNNTIEFEPSLSDLTAIRTDPVNLRPGVSVDLTMTVNSNRVNQRWPNAKSVDKTIHFLRHNVGFTDELGSA